MERKTAKHGYKRNDVKWNIVPKIKLYGVGMKFCQQKYRHWYWLSFVFINNVWKISNIYLKDIGFHFFYYWIYIFFGRVYKKNSRLSSVGKFYFFVVANRMWFWDISVSISIVHGYILTTLWIVRELFAMVCERDLVVMQLCNWNLFRDSSFFITKSANFFNATV